jgi:SAM-dependent methyltransferase
MRALVPAGARALAGTAERLPLPDASVDAVVVGQAWHWFDEDRALAEVRRVLRPGGVLGLLWNVFDDRVPWVAELVALTEAGDRLSAEDTLPHVAGLTGELRRFVHTQAMTPDLLVENIRSRSGTVLLPPEQRAARLGRVRELAPDEAFDLTWVCHTVRLVPG